jgi:hypothetical protein
MGRSSRTEKPHLANRLRQKYLKRLRGPQSRDNAAKAVGVSPRYVSDAKKVKEEAPEIFEQVKRGEKTKRASPKDWPP